MILTINKYIGKNQYSFAFNGNTLYEVITQAQQLSFENVPNCGICQSNDLLLQTRNPKNQFEIIYVFCLNCKGQLDYTNRKDKPNVFFLKRKPDGNLDWYQLTIKN